MSKFLTAEKAREISTSKSSLLPVRKYYLDMIKKAARNRQRYVYTDTPGYYLHVDDVRFFQDLGYEVTCDRYDLKAQMYWLGMIKW
jgi:hypothetical protein